MEQVSSLKTGIKYKDTPIGQIPVDWEVLKLNNIGELKGGNGFSEKYQGHRDLKYLFIKVSDMNLPCNDIYIRNSINTIDDELKEILKCNIFPRDTIVFAKVGAALLLNRRRIITKETAIDNNMMGLIVKKGYYPKFYYYILQTIDFAKYVFSGALPSVNQKIIGDIDVVSPPLNEQKGIAEILTTVDKAIGKTTQFIEKTKELKKGLMQSLLTKGIEHNKFKKTEIGEIPDEWEVKRLIDLAGNEKYSFTGGPFGSDLKENCYTDHGIRIIQLQNIGDGEFLDDYKIFTSEEKANELRSCNIYPGDIIIAKMADPVARACIIPDMDKRYLMASDGIRLSINEKENDTNFVLYAINSTYFRKNAEKYSTGTTRLRIGLTELRNLPIGIPPLKEQKKIIDILSSIDDEIKKESNHKEQLETLKKGLMQVLLTGKLRVGV